VNGVAIPDDLLLLPEEDDLRACITEPSTMSRRTDLERVLLITAFYKLLHQKYNLDFSGSGSTWFNSSRAVSRIW
jgi:hypothetical protein